MLRLGPIGERILQGIVLAMAGAVASMGVTFGCLLRNIVRDPSSFTHNLGRDRASLAADRAEALADHGELIMPGTTVVDMGLTAFYLVLMLAWLLAVWRFARFQPRSWLTRVLVALILVPFLGLCWMQWLLAYPVCNVF